MSQWDSMCRPGIQTQLDWVILVGWCWGVPGHIPPEASSSPLIHDVAAGRGLWVHTLPLAFTQPPIT
jgi:hypothetical protein